MARPPRIEYSGAFYHVINRGIERRQLFGVDEDYEFFLKICWGLNVRYQVKLLAYCLMPNHYHLFLRTEAGGLQRYMHELGSRYGKHYNRRCHRIGPIFQGRYRALLVDAERRALDVVRYIHMNPVKAELVDTPGAYRWSSYREYVGEEGTRSVDVDFVLSRFRGTRTGRIRQLRAFTSGKGGAGYSPEVGAVGGLIVGGERFVDWVKKEKVPRRRPINVARWAELQKPSAGLKRSMRRRVEAITGDEGLRRKLLVCGLKYSTPLSLGEIARMVGMGSISAVSQTIRRLNAERKEDEVLDRLVSKLEQQCRSGQ